VSGGVDQIGASSANVFFESEFDAKRLVIADVIAAGAVAPVAPVHIRPLAESGSEVHVAVQTVINIILVQICFDGFVRIVRVDILRAIAAVIAAGAIVPPVHIRPLAESGSEVHVAVRTVVNIVFVQIRVDGFLRIVRMEILRVWSTQDSGSSLFKSLPTKQCGT